MQPTLKVMSSRSLQSLAGVGPALTGSPTLVTKCVEERLWGSEA